MFIKYQHARNGGIVALVGGAVAAIALNAGDDPTPPYPPIAPPPRVAPVTPPPAEPLAAVSPPITRPPAVTPTDAAVIAIASRPSGGAKKKKDALGGASPWKVNLYDDDGDGRWERLKLDRNRDDRWDSKWNFKDGLWEDGESKRVWRDGRWTPRASAPTPTPTRIGGVALKVVAAMGGRASAKKVKDLYRGAGAKVNLYDDDGDGVWDRAKIDLDRDDNWDEKLSRKAAGMERKVEASGEVFVLSGDAWKKK